MKLQANVTFRIELQSRALCRDARKWPGSIKGREARSGRLSAREPLSSGIPDASASPFSFPGRTLSRAPPNRKRPNGQAEACLLSAFSRFLDSMMLLFGPYPSLANLSAVVPLPYTMSSRASCTRRSHPGTKKERVSLPHPHQHLPVISAFIRCLHCADARLDGSCHALVGW